MVGQLRNFFLFLLVFATIVYVFLYQKLLYHKMPGLLMNVTTVVQPHSFNVTDTDIALVQDSEDISDSSQQSTMQSQIEELVSRVVVELVDSDPLKSNTIQGLPFHDSWAPMRSWKEFPRMSENLSISGATTTLIIDNYWHLQNYPLFKENWTITEDWVLGDTFGNDKQLPSKLKRAPPLPKCLPLSSGGTIHSPGQENAGDWPDYDLSYLVLGKKTSEDEYLQDLPQTVVAEPFVKVPALVWHRIAFKESVIGGRDFLLCGGDECPHSWVQMTTTGRSRFCEKAAGTYNPDLEPRDACNGGRRGPPVSFPWCNRELAAVGVVSVDCLVSESSMVHPDVFYTLISLAGSGWRVSHNGPGRAKIPRDTQVIELEEAAAIGASQYVGAPGHFFNEVLPRLMHLDMVLPSHVPLLWNAGPVASTTIGELRAAGLFSSRTLINAPSPGLVRARRMYTYASEYGSGHTPLVVYMSQAFLQVRLGRYFAGKGLIPNERILYLSRSGGRARSVVNEGELIAALRQAFPDRQVESFEPGISPELPWMEIQRRVYSAAAIIGPHGANLGNVVGARLSTVMIEFGYAGGMKMPSDFFCLARNVGMNYWMSPNLSGDYSSPMTVDIADIVNILQTAKLRPAPSKK